MEDGITVFIGALIIGLAIVGGCAIGEGTARNRLTTSAIQAGVAQYQITNQITGATEFQWKTNQVK